MPASPANGKKELSAFCWDDEEDGVVEVDALLTDDVDVFDDEELGAEETAAIESKNIFMFMLLGNADRRLGLKPARPEFRDEGGKPKLVPDVGVEF